MIARDSFHHFPPFEGPTMSADKTKAPPRHPDRSRQQRHQGHFRRAQRDPCRHLRALPEDQEFPLACLGSAFPRLPPDVRRAGRPALRLHRRHCRACAQDRRHHAALDRRHRAQAAALRQRRRLCRAHRTCWPNCARTISAASPRCARRTSFATNTTMSRPQACSRIFIDEAEKRVWFLYEAGRRGSPTGQ